VIQIPLLSQNTNSQDSTARSDFDEDEPSLDLELELSENHNDVLWNLEAQLQAQLDTVQLAQLHADIKTRVELLDPAYEKLPRS